MIPRNLKRLHVWHSFRKKHPSIRSPSLQDGILEADGLARASAYEVHGHPIRSMCSYSDNSYCQEKRDSFALSSLRHLAAPDLVSFAVWIEKEKALRDL